MKNNGMSLVKVGSLMIFGGYILAAIGSIKMIKDLPMTVEQELNDLETEDVNIDNSVVENSDDYHF